MSHAHSNTQREGPVCIGRVGVPVPLTCVICQGKTPPVYVPLVVAEGHGLLPKVECLDPGCSGVLVVLPTTKGL